MSNPVFGKMDSFSDVAFILFFQLKFFEITFIVLVALYFTYLHTELFDHNVIGPEETYQTFFH